MSNLNDKRKFTIRRKSEKMFYVHEIRNFEFQTGYAPHFEVGALFETTSSFFHHSDSLAEPPYFDDIYEETRVKSAIDSDRIYVINSSLNTI